MAVSMRNGASDGNSQALSNRAFPWRIFPVFLGRNPKIEAPSSVPPLLTWIRNILKHDSQLQLLLRPRSGHPVSGAHASISQSYQLSQRNSHECTSSGTRAF